MINLISDTVTKPSKGMLKAMIKADVGDDVFKADPTVNKLQSKLAEMFGKQDALFFPSGSMANQAAIKLHTNPGEQMICDKWAHVYNFEGGGAAVNSGVSSLLINGHRGMFKANDFNGMINSPQNIHTAITTLVSIENTTNKGGGACWDFSEIKKIKKICTTNNLSFHLDGARLFNALIAKNETPKQYGKVFDTISICLSKGLGAPIGSVLIGSKNHIEKALRIRKLFGGAMRQSGYLAAAGIYALDHNVERLIEDHQKATLLGNTLNNLAFIKNIEPIETNIIIFNLIDTVDTNVFIEKLKQLNILISNMGQGKLRMVTHLDITNEMLKKVIKTFKMLKF